MSHNITSLRHRAATAILGVTTKAFEALGAKRPVRRFRQTLPTKVSEDQFTEMFVSQIARLPVRSKQLLMLDMYADRNLFLERFIDFLANPIVGKQGFTIDYSPDAPKTKQVLRRFTYFNKLHLPHVQRALVRDGLLTGELCFLKVPHAKRQTDQLIQIAAPVIRQTIVDPGDYTKVIAVEQELGRNKVIRHKVICDEDVLSEEALRLREQMTFSCYLYQNRKRSHPTLSPYGTDLLHKYEIRGEPFLINSADLLQSLVSYLWKTLDKMDSWNLFNYKFSVKTSSTETDDIQEELDQWASYIGKPEPNSALFLPEDLITMEPVTFPMQSTDLGQFYRMVRNATAWHGATRETAMGEGDVRYASNQAAGVSEPSVETKEVLQREFVDFLRYIYDTECHDELENQTIPAQELREEFPPEFAYTIISNEISKVSQIEPMEAFSTFVDTVIKLKDIGLYEGETLEQVVTQKGKELLDIDLKQQEMETETREESMEEDPSKSPSKIFDFEESRKKLLTN